MKNNFKKIIIIIFINIINLNFLAEAIEQFEFNVTEIEITNNGNKFKGQNRGQITAENGIIIYSDNFTYDKTVNILNADGNVEIYDKVNNLVIFSDQLIYIKNNETFNTNGNSRAFLDNIEIKSKKLFYNKTLNLIKAKEDVEINDKINGYFISSDEIDYFKNEEKILSSGKTSGTIKLKYQFESSDINLLRVDNKISSKNKTVIIDDKQKKYSMDNFEFFYEKELLKAKNLEIIFDNSVEKIKSDNLFFKDSFFNLKENSYLASDTFIKLRKDSFNNEENDPRLYGSSSSSINGITKINKGIFTSCKVREDKCPPWSIKSKRIIHDKNKKRIEYDNAFFRIYDVPVLYFPKFFHPDPTVKRQSGFLKPKVNKSEILGTSIYLPYFHIIAEDKDFTFKPIIFDNNIFMIQNEFRSESKFSSFIADFSYTNGYKSSIASNKNSISHLFTKYKKNLNLNNFTKSEINFSVEKTSNDTYLKVFDTNLLEIDTLIKPSNYNSLKSSFDLTLEKNDSSLLSGIKIYENLTVNKTSDRYEFILPYYEFYKNLSIEKNINGYLDFFSSGNNTLSNTNNLRSRIINNLNFSSKDYFINNGLKNKFRVYGKNLNTVAKNDSLYKNSPQIEVVGIFELESSIPMLKNSNKTSEYLEPRISLRYNPFDTKNYSTSDRGLSVDTIFDVNRLGIDDSFEPGMSLTAGLNYKKEKISTKDINNYFEVKLATSYRPQEEEFLPEKSTLNQKYSNIFGSIEKNYNDTLKIKYNFSLDNDISSIEYNNFNTSISANNIIAEIMFIEANGKIGNQSIIDNSLSYIVDEQNSLSFKTRRNRKLNLTEYYDLMYEYKSDCLTAGIKYKKTYYQDRDLKPSEDLLLTFTFYPLTTYEQKIDQNLYK